MPSFPLVQCSVVKIGGQEKISSNSATVQFPHTESVAQNMILENSYDGYINFQETSTADELASTPSKPTSLIESNDVRIAAGSVVWAKTASDMWWPAKIIKGKSTADVSSDQGADGHVQVQYFRNHENAWLTPDGDISQFDQCFIERSSNPLATFQDALKQALYFKEQLSHRRESDRKSDGFMRSRQEQPSVEPLVKCIESSSSRTENSLEKGRGKRKRKPKVLFENVNVRTKTARKVRRFRIMRPLGLTAPIGSPFSPASELGGCKVGSSH